MEVKYISVPCDDELYAAVAAEAERNGRKLGPEIAWRLQKWLKVGVFAPKVAAAASAAVATISVESAPTAADQPEGVTA